MPNTAPDPRLEACADVLEWPVVALVAVVLAALCFAAWLAVR